MVMSSGSRFTEGIEATHKDWWDRNQTMSVSPSGSGFEARYSNYSPVARHYERGAHFAAGPYRTSMRAQIAAQGMADRYDAGGNLEGYLIGESDERDY